jgi:hypothetical protein
LLRPSRSSRRWSIACLDSLLTAAHCTADTVGKTLVDFRSVLAYTPPTGYPLAADPAAGYTRPETEKAGFLSGTAYAHPESGPQKPTPQSYPLIRRYAVQPGRS